MKKPYSQNIVMMSETLNIETAQMGPTVPGPAGCLGKSSQHQVVILLLLKQDRSKR